MVVRRPTGVLQQRAVTVPALPPTSVNTGEFSVPLRQVGSLAPVAQVVVYAGMPTGEFLADSQDFPVQLCLNNKVQPRLEGPPEGGGRRC